MPKLLNIFLGIDRTVVGQLTETVTVGLLAISALVPTAWQVNQNRDCMHIRINGHDSELRGRQPQSAPDKGRVRGQPITAYPKNGSDSRER